MTMTQTTEAFSIPTSTRTIHSTSLSASQELSDEESDEYFWENPPEVSYIETAGIVPVAFLGTLGNIIALIVWTAETRYNATTLLLKHLCVWDSLFLLTYATLILGHEAMSADVTYATELFISMFLLMSLHVTLVVIVTRLLAVTRPLVVRDLLTRRRVYVVYVGIIVWCLVLVSLEIAANKSQNLEMIQRWNIFVSKQVIGFMLPYVALLVSNVFLFYFLWRHRTISRQTLHQSSPVTNRRTDRRLTLTLICMSVCSLFAYSPGVFFQLLREAEFAGLISATSTCDWECSVLVERVFHLLQVLNSSVNIIFYAAFSTRFRQLFLHRVQQVSGLVRSLSPSLSSSCKREVETANL